MVTSHRPVKHRPRHRAPLYHRGRHRAAFAVHIPTQGRYAVVVGTAVLSAGAVALGSAAALPSAEPEQPTAAQPRVEPPAQRAPAGYADVVTNELLDVPDGDGDSPGTEQPAEVTWRLPLDEVHLTSLFGPRWGLLHQGVDFAAPHGAPVHAAQSGTVIAADWNGGFGQLVVIDHGDGVSTYYAHNSRLRVSVGQRVLAGDHIADVGDTGDSYGPHSHFELHVDGEAVDPVGYLAEVGVDLLDR